MYNCDDCKHIKKCKEEYGEDDYFAVIGTHHCLRSWDSLFQKKEGEFQQLPYKTRS